MALDRNWRICNSQWQPWRRPWEGAVLCSCLEDELGLWGSLADSSLGVFKWAPMTLVTFLPMKGCQIGSCPPPFGSPSVSFGRHLSPCLVVVAWEIQWKMKLFLCLSSSHSDHEKAMVLSMRRCLRWTSFTLGGRSCRCCWLWWNQWHGGNSPAGPTLPRFFPSRNQDALWWTSVSKMFITIWF